MTERSFVRIDQRRSQQDGTDDREPEWSLILVRDSRLYPRSVDGNRRVFTVEIYCFVASGRREQFTFPAIRSTLASRTV